MNIIIDTRFRRVRRNGTLRASLPFFIAYNFCCNYHGMVPQDTRVPFTSRALCSSVLLPRHFASLLYNNTRTVFRDVYGWSYCRVLFFSNQRSCSIEASLTGSARKGASFSRRASSWSVFFGRSRRLPLEYILSLVSVISSRWMRMSASPIHIIAISHYFDSCILSFSLFAYAELLFSCLSLLFIALLSAWETKTTKRC